MLSSPQVVEASSDARPASAVVSWLHRDGLWRVSIVSPAFGRFEASADDAFEALCRVREELDAGGWRVGVAGAQSNVWPSGMARDQGGGLTAYRMTEDGVVGVVDTFAPVDPATTVPVAEQRREADRLLAAIARRGATGAGEP